MTGIKTIQLNCAADATPQVKDDLFYNNLDKLVINFDIDTSDTQRIRQIVFNPYQKDIKFDIEIRSKSARMLFCELKNLQAITGKIEAPKLNKAEFMFKECESLTTIPKLCFPNLDYTYAMFIGCSKLTSVDLDFPNLKIASCMFGGCESLTTVNLKYNKLVDSAGMFTHCTSLTSVPNLDFSSVSCAPNMFANCTGFTSIPDLNCPNLRYASGMFKNCSELTSVGDLTFPNLKDASGMFEGCGKIATTGELDFGSNAEIYHCFLDKFSIFETGIPYFKDNYLKGTSVYPDWYFRSSISNTIFNFDTFFDEMFKFISSYRGLGEHGFGINNLQNEMLNKKWHIDVIEIYSRIMDSYLNSNDRLRHYIDISRIRHNYLNSTVTVSHTVDLSSPPPSLYVLDNDRDSDCIGSVLDMFFEERKNRKHRYDPDDSDRSAFELDILIHERKNRKHRHAPDDSDYSAFELRHLVQESCFNKATPLNNFEIEFSDEKRYMTIGKYRVSLIEHEGRKLSEKYPEWSDLIGSIINKLEDQTNSENLVKVVEEPGELEKAIEKLDKADDKPEEIKDWLHKVKNREINIVILGCFVPSSYPLKIVMYTKTIKERAKKNNISYLHLFETVFAHEFFHALHFIVCMLKLLENKSFISEMCKRYDIKHSRIDQTTAEDIWKNYIQQKTANHMLDYGLDVRREVEEPLAVAFEISWVKDRMTTQKDSAEWKKIMDYELQRFKGLYTYPTNPYYGGLYLVTTKADRSTVADMQTINANISKVLRKSAEDMHKAHEHIQKELM